MISAPSLLANGLWVLGLAGVVATFSYMNWLRSVRQWSWRQTLKMPIFLTPFTLSLFLFSGGIALTGLFSGVPTPWWQTIAWSVLTLLFGIQAVIYTRAGRRDGWDIPIEGKNNHE